MSTKNQSELEHAKNFSLVMFGAAMLYNLMLAEKKRDEQRISEYSSELDNWAEEIEESWLTLRAWSRSAFWTMLRETGARITLPTELFINVWLDRALSSKPSGINSSKNARILIIERERTLKRGLARLDNPRALDLWRGASGRYRLDYRWNRPVTQILADIHNALES